MQWSRKIYEQEEIPPPHCWEEIREKIAEEPVRLGHALYEMEATPPAGSWENIRSEIVQVPAVPQEKPVRNLHRPVLSYAAAIIGFGILASILIYVLNRKDTGLNVKDLAAGLTYTDSQKNISAVPDIKPADSTRQAKINDIKNSGNQIELSENQDTRSMPSKAETSVGKTAHRAIVSPSKKKGPDRGSLGNETVVAEPVVNYSDGNYIQLVEPDGDVTRVSYKLAEMVRTVHQDGRTKNRQDQQRWNRTLESWKAKMAQSTYVPSGSNFFDIAEMIEFLNTENR
jgi:hypothetical protein